MNVRLQGDGCHHGHNVKEQDHVADEWIRLYVRKEKLAAPAAAEVIGVLLARVCYGLTFAKLLHGTASPNQCPKPFGFVVSGSKVGEGRDGTTQQ